MSGYNQYPPYTSPLEEEEFDYSNYTTHGPQTQHFIPPYAQQTYQGYDANLVQANEFYQQAQQTLYDDLQQQQWAFPTHPVSAPAWATPTVPSNAPYQTPSSMPAPAYSDTSQIGESSPEMVTAGPSRLATGYLSPGPRRSRVSRSASFVSEASSSRSYSMSDVSRSASPSAAELSRWGRRNEDGTWSCAHAGCTSRSTFSRGCDLRKHYKRHTKSWFCSYQDCPQAHEGGFSSKKDKARHEAKHNPQIVCEWEGCNRLFSRTDNMKDHVKRMHTKQKG